MEAVRRRVQDRDDPMKPLTVRAGQGDQDRCTPGPAPLIPWLQNHRAGVRTRHPQDLVQGYGEVDLPHALARKYPATVTEWGWQDVFPARHLAVDPRAGITRRHHVDPSVINQASKVAVRRAGLTPHLSAHTFRHACATHRLPRGTDIRMMPPWLGHHDVATTMLDTPVRQQGGQGVPSPWDDLGV
jgi:integrase